MRRGAMPPVARPAGQASHKLQACHGGRALKGLDATAVGLAMWMLVVALPAPSEAIFLRQQNITTASQATYCGFYSIVRYKTWCDSNISAFVASNSSCQQYGMCIPLDGDDAMTCDSGATCSGWRREGTAVAACLVLQAEADTAPEDGSPVLCDVDIEGASVFEPPPPPPGPAPPSPPEGTTKRRDWALWKTMTIIWSILGFAAFLVIAVLLICLCIRRRARTPTSSPVTILSPEDKKKIEEEARGELQRGAAEATVTLRPTAPDGKPILVYGSSYPPPPPFIPGITANGINRLPPNAGDALLKSVADSRAAYNGPPMRMAPANISPLTGAAMLPPGPAQDPAAAAAAAVAAVGAAAAAAAPTTAAAVAISGAHPPYDVGPAPGAAGMPLTPGLGPGPGAGDVAAALAEGGGLASGAAAAAAAAAPLPIPIVTPAALVPPPAATLQNPPGSA